MSTLNSKFQSKSIEELKTIYSLIVDKFENKIPVVFFLKSQVNNIPPIEIKFLATPNTELSYLANEIRKKLELKSDSVLYFYTLSGKIWKQDTTISEIYETCKHESGFLFMEVSEVEIFG